MTATAAELLADLLGPSADARGARAKAANPANREHPCGFRAESGAANGLRIPANPGPQPAALAPDSQTFAGDSQGPNRPAREHWRGVSQDSHGSQEHTPARASQSDDVAGREAFEERAAILEFDGGLTRAEAEAQARLMVAPSATAAPDLSAVAWTDGDIARFLDVQARLIRWQWPAHEAEALAARIVNARRYADDRVSCAACRHFRPWRCANHEAAGLMADDVGRDLAAMLQRCGGFNPRMGER